MNKKTFNMKKSLITKLTILFLPILFFTSCAVFQKGKTNEQVFKSDSIMYAKLFNDSIANIVLNSSIVTCKLQSINPIDTIRTDSIRTLPSNVINVLKFLFFDPSNFKSNDIVYGNFSSSVCYSFKTQKDQLLFLYLDFGLKKWKLLDCNKKEICISDMKDSYMLFLRLTRIIFSTDVTLNLLYNNLFFKK